MTFTTYTFLMLFLPVVVAGYYALSRVFTDSRPGLLWLLAASLLFYGSLGPGYLVIIIGSVLFNFAVSWWMTSQPPESSARQRILGLGIVGNLVLLGTYKYTGFLADNLNAVMGTHFEALSVAYPIGLSFYTFIQIGYLIDTSVGQVQRPTFLRYALFGTFFPYVTAGPIVRPREIFDQLDTPVRRRIGGTQIAVGATMFAMGLFKKAVLADSVAPYAGTLFTFASGHDNIGASNAWLGMLAYTLQLYFDFSGYTDMALGIGYILGIRLPINFNSPLKATSIIEFWRRWHMTMTRWFTDFIYTPLAAAMMRRSLRGGYSTAARLLVVLCLPVIVTFLLVGLWHGAGWGFVIWGAIQGAAMTVNLTHDGHVRILSGILPRAGRRHRHGDRALDVRFRPGRPAGCPVLWHHRAVRDRHRDPGTVVGDRAPRDCLGIPQFAGNSGGLRGGSDDHTVTRASFPTATDMEAGAALGADLRNGRRNWTGLSRGTVTLPLLQLLSRNRHDPCRSIRAGSRAGRGDVHRRVESGHRLWLD
jgi:alginate O-acetyltransferase complex protein AlgI